MNKYLNMGILDDQFGF